MTASSLPRFLLERIDYLALRRYLEARGWQKAKSRRPDVVIYHLDEHEAVLPLTEDFVDYADSLRAVVRAVAASEGRSPEAVLETLLRPEFDRIRVAVEGKQSADGTLGLNQSLQLVTGIRKALVSAACSAERPARFHPRASLRRADAFVSACRFGQTEVGSFVTTIDCPVALEDEELGLSGLHTPFGRAVSTRFVQSVAALTHAVLTGEHSDITAAPDGAALVSANFCEAILEMMPDPEDAALRVEVSWSPSAPPPAIPAKARIERRFLPSIEEFARALRPEAAPSELKFVGTVDELKGDPGPTGRAEGAVVVLLQIDGEVVRARALLAPDDYRTAAEAHLAGRHVACRGTLRRRARLSLLEEVSEFAEVR